ncbi:TPA: hypothetical protein ACQ8RA_001586 [Escherichia coli]
MTPMMHERVRNMFGDAGLTVGFTVQKLVYDDPEDLTQAVMVFRPNGGSNIRHDLGSEHHVLVDVIGAKDKRGDAANAVQRIVDYPYRDRKECRSCPANQTFTAHLWLQYSKTQRGISAFTQQTSSASCAPGTGISAMTTPTAG